MRLAFALALAALLAAAPAAAHRLSPAYFGMVESAPGVFDVQWKVSITGGLAAALEPKVPPQCSITGGVRSYPLSYAGDEARVQLAELACSEGLEGAPFEIEGLPATQTDVLLRIDFLDGASFTRRLTPEAPATVIETNPGAMAVIGTYLVLGVEHILLGIDHLLFVLALVLIVRGVRRLVVTVTAFTVAHNITLGAAALGYVRMPSAAVVATIALSILFLASELARRDPAGGHEDLTTRFPWIVAFSFGLLHGFGFAGALAEIGMPEQAVPLALLFFNVGVELGQLAFVAAVLGLGALVARWSLPVPAWWPRATAYAIGTLAAFWVFERSVAIW